MTQETTNHSSALQSSHCSLIIALVAKEHGLTPAQLLAEDRTPAVSRPRQMAMLLARELTGASYPDLAKAFQRKDHNTIMHGCEMARRRKMGSTYRRLHQKMTARFHAATSAPIRESDVKWANSIITSRPTHTSHALASK